MNRSAFFLEIFIKLIQSNTNIESKQISNIAKQLQKSIMRVEVRNLLLLLLIIVQHHANLVHATETTKPQEF